MDTKVSCNDSSKAQCATFQSLFTYTYTYAYTYSHIHFRAMGGQVLFQDALAARLELIKPSKVDLQNCLTQRPCRLHFMEHLNFAYILFISNQPRKLLEALKKYISKKSDCCNRILSLPIKKKTLRKL